MSNFDISNNKSRLDAKNQFDGNLIFGAKKFHSETKRTGKGRPSDGGLVREYKKVINTNNCEKYERIDEFWEKVDFCPVCKSKKRKFFLTRFSMDIYKCEKCNHRYLSPRIKYEKASELYNDDKTASDIYLQPIQQEIDKKKYNYGLTLLSKIGTPSMEKIMDIGCGAGVFLEEAKAFGWNSCIGVDANKRYSNTYREIKGIQFIQSNFELLDVNKLGSDYDCISLWNCLEHIYDLKKLLIVIKKLLKRNGLLFVMVPNIESLATRIIREKSPTFGWKHVSHFCSESLVKLMQDNGLDKVHMETAITEIDNIKSYLSGAYPYHGYGDPDNLFDFITPEYIHSRMLGSRIIGIFKNA